MPLILIPIQFRVVGKPLLNSNSIKFPKEILLDMKVAKLKPSITINVKIKIALLLDQT